MRQDTFVENFWQMAPAVLLEVNLLMDDQRTLPIIRWHPKDGVSYGWSFLAQFG